MVETICQTIEDYLTKYWTESGIKDMATSIREVTQHNANKASEEFKNMAKLTKMQKLIKDSKGKGGDWLSGLMARYEEQKRKWEIKKAKIIQARADAIMKCMSSVLHVVTLNIGISMQPREKLDIMSRLHASCVGRGNAFWPQQKAQAKEFVVVDSAPSTRAQTAATSNSAMFSVTRLPLHRMPGEDSLRQTSRGSASSPYRLDTETYRLDTGEDQESSDRFHTPLRSSSRPIMSPMSSPRPSRTGKRGSFSHKETNSNVGSSRQEPKETSEWLSSSTVYSLCSIVLVTVASHSLQSAH